MKLKNYSLKKWKMKCKKLVAEEFEKIYTEANKEMEELKSTLAMLQKHVKNLKRSNEEPQKNAKNMKNTVDVYV